MEKTKMVRCNFKGLKCSRADLFASLASDNVLVRIVRDTDVFLFNVKSIEKVQGYYDFWKVKGYIDSVKEAVLFVDYSPCDGYPEGGFGYLEYACDGTM